MSLHAKNHVSGSKTGNFEVFELLNEVRNKKRCTHASLHRLTQELKRPNQRQRAFLRHLKCLIQNRYEAQSCSTKKVSFPKWCRFYVSMIFRPWPLPSGGFIQKIPHKSVSYLTRVI